MRPVLLLCLLARAAAAERAVQRYFAARGAGALEPYRGAPARAAVADQARPAQQNKPEKGNASEKFSFSPNSLLKSYQSVFRTDDDDLRTGYKNLFDIWPFFYHNLYEYEPQKLEVEAQKAIDKRFAAPPLERSIPVHEDVDDTADGQAATPASAPQEHERSATAATDNPVFGDKPFFSYVLNDYFDKTDQDDPTTSKGISWEKEFDHELALQEIDDAKRLRRLQETNPNDNRKEGTFLSHDTSHESLNNKGRASHRESEANEEGDDSKHSYDGSYQYNGENYGDFKDVLDSFANRFGFEEHERESNFAKKNNIDKGGKKKGFRKVYHKDEYQEHHDFFDNTDNNENMEEKGASKVHIGGSEGVLRSLAGAVTGNEESKLSNAENIDKKQYQRNHKDEERYNDTEREFDHYRDVARSTALGNDADYADRYLT